MIQPSYEEFKNAWLEEVLAGNPSPTEKGNRFSHKLLADYLNYNLDDYYSCDGTKDGGIDIAYLISSDIQDNDTTEGNTWYIVQSKYGKAFQGTKTIIEEGNKIIETLDGKRTSLNSLSSEVLERILNFINNAGENDRLVLMYATPDPLTDDEKITADDVSTIGKKHFGNLFEIEFISIQTIYNRFYGKITIDLIARLSPSVNDLWVGSVTLFNIYNFLKKYKKETGDLDKIYEKNVRQFLGPKRPINKGIAETLNNNPEKFGLFNNGITVVAENVSIADNICTLTDPYIVNGCQTTRTIWNNLLPKLDSGTKQINSSIESLIDKLNKSIVIIKVVQIGKDNESELREITRFTNTQNKVNPSDFIALEESFQTYADEMENKYNIYFEIQKAAWDSVVALQKRKSSDSNKYIDHVNAFEMLKIYGSAWLSKPGTAFNKNPPFAPGGDIFEQIVESNNFDSESIYACYLLKTKSIGKFGRKYQESRKLTKYLFYFTIVYLIKQILINTNRDCIDDMTITKSIIKILKSDLSDELVNEALGVIDEYLDKNKDYSVFNEPEFQRTQDLNYFLKSDKFGNDNQFNPNLINDLNVSMRVIQKSISNQASLQDRIHRLLDS